jgi:hypothetical protein
MLTFTSDDYIARISKETDGTHCVVDEREDDEEEEDEESRRAGRGRWQ